MKKFLYKYSLKITGLFLMIALVGGWSSLIGVQRSKNLVFGYGGGFGGGGGGGGYSAPAPTLLDTGGPTGTGFVNTGSIDTGDNIPATNRGDAYKFAKENSISTMPTYLEARLESGISRGEAAKVVVQYYKNILKRSITRSDVCNPSNFKDFSTMDSETKGYVRDACSIGAMGWKNNKSGTIEYFRPYAGVTRGEIAAILSRMIYNTASSDSSDSRYITHINVLRTNGVLPNDKSPQANELRGDVFEMLQKATK